MSPGHRWVLRDHTLLWIRGSAVVKVRESSEVNEGFIIVDFIGSWRCWTLTRICVSKLNLFRFQVVCWTEEIFSQFSSFSDIKYFICCLIKMKIISGGSHFESGTKHPPWWSAPCVRHHLSPPLTSDLWPLLWMGTNSFILRYNSRAVSQKHRKQSSRPESFWEIKKKETVVREGLKKLLTHGNSPQCASTSSFHFHLHLVIVSQKVLSFKKLDQWMLVNLWTNVCLCLVPRTHRPDDLKVHYSGVVFAV